MKARLLFLVLALCLVSGVSASRRALLGVQRPAASGAVTPPSIAGTVPIGTNFGAGSSGVYTRTIDASTTYALVAASEFSVSITGLVLSNSSSSVAATRHLWTNDAASSFLSVWKAASPPTGSIDIHWVASGSPFPTVLLLPFKDVNLGSPFSAGTTNDWNGLAGARPGTTNTIASAVNELVVGFAGGASLDNSVAVTSGASAGKFFVSGGGSDDVHCITNEGASLTTIGYTSSSVIQGAIVVSLKP